MNGPLGQGTDVLATDAGPEERAHIDYVRTYLHDAVARGLLRPVDAARLDADLAVRAAPAPPPPTALAPPPAPGPAVGPAPVATPAAQGPWASRPPAPAPAPAPTPMPGPAPSGGPVPQPVLQPSAVGAWVLRARESITADLAVHGLADLGVLLLFAGLFGFVAFAFGQVRLGLRPVAEAAIPLVLFGAGAFLRHRGTRVVGEALTFLGGLLLPVVLVASLIDGASPPPDLGGRSLALAMAAGLAALAVAFALLVWRRPSSPLRFLVAPMGWLCTAALGLLLADVPEGAKIVAPEAWSWGLATVAAGASVVAVDVARRRGRSGPLVDGTALAAWPGLPATYGLTLAASAAHGWPVGPLLAAGAAVIVGIDVLGRGRRGWVVPAAQTVPLVVAAAAVAAHESRPEVGAALVVVGALALAERHARRQTVAEAVWALVGVAAAALVVAEAASFGSDDAPLVAVVVGAAAWTWALLRVLRPRGPLGGPALEVGVVAIPLLVGPVAGVGWSEAWSALVLAALLVAGAAAVRATSERERPIWAVAIPLWGWWLLASLVAIASWGSGVAAATSALVAAAFVLAPRFPVLRAWGAVVAVVVAVLAGLDAVDASGMATALVLLGIGLATVLVGEARWRRPVLGHLVLAGQLVIGLGAIGALVVWGDGEADDPSGLMAVAQVAVLVGWAVVALLHEVRWSNLTDLLARRSPRTGDPSHRGVDRYACRIPLGLAVVAYPVAVGTVAASTGRFADDASWPAAIAVAALVPLAWAARVLADRGRRGPSMVCAHIGLAMAVLAGFATIGALDPVWPIAVASAFVVAFVVVEGPARRGAGSTSLGVLASGAAVAALGSIVGVAGSSEAGLVAALWGSMLVVGALVADEQRYGARPRGQVVRSATGWPPVVFGAAGLAGGALMALEGWPEPAGAALMLAAVAVLLVALLLREPWGSFGWWLLLLAAAPAFAPAALVDRPLGWVVATVVLLVAAEVLGRLAARAGSSGADRRARWDLPAFAAAHVAALAALVASVDAGWVPATWLAVAALSAAVGVRVRRAPWALAAVPLALVGAGAAGPSWLAMALALTAIAAFVVAQRASGSVRGAAQAVVGVASAGAWASFLVWRGWLPTDGWDVVAEGRWVAVTAIGGAAIVLVVAILVRLRDVDRAWWVVSLGAAGTWAAAATVAGWPDRSGAIAVVVAAAAVALMARPTHQAVLRDVAAGLLLLSVGEVVADAGMSISGVAWTAIGWSILATLAIVALTALGRGGAWIRPAWVLVGGTLATMWVAAVSVPPGDGRTLVVAALLVTGLECALLGVVRRVEELVLAAPWWFAAAWIAAGLDRLDVQPVWASLPVGLALLVTVALARAQRRASSRPVAAPELVWLDLAGMALVAAPPLVEAAQGRLALVGVGVAIGCAFAVWGVLSRVRRRLFAGIAVVVASVAILVLVPLLDNLPEFRGPTLWLAIAAVGGLAIVVAAFLERGRQIGRSAVASVRARTAGWE